MAYNSQTTISYSLRGRSTRHKRTEVYFSQFELPSLLEEDQIQSQAFKLQEHWERQTEKIVWYCCTANRSTGASGCLALQKVSAGVQVSVSE